jgi:hypothetical protein
MEQEKIFIAADAAEQDTLEAGVYTILKRWELQIATEENYKAMQKEVCDFCRYWLFKHGTPTKRMPIKAISTVCKIELTEVKK